MEKTLQKLRDAGWRVAVHNDYQVDDQLFHFWLMTHPSGIYAKGEGVSDDHALSQIEARARKYGYI
jgi:hypothetical protein